MKVSGIVRKLDELGRIVIPKEIRDKMGIKQDEKLEITILDESIVLNKFSEIKNIKKFSDLFCENIYNATNQTTLICDREIFISTCGPNKKKYKDLKISVEIKETLLKNNNYIASTVDKTTLIPISNDIILDYDSELIFPIIKDGVCEGGIIIIGENIKFGECEIRMLKFASALLGQSIC